LDTKPTGKPVGTPITEDAQISALRQVVKKEEASVEMKQRDESLASYSDTAPATESWPDSIPWEEEKILVNEEVVHIKWESSPPVHQGAWPTNSCPPAMNTMGSSHPF